MKSKAAAIRIYISSRQELYPQQEDITLGGKEFMFIFKDQKEASVEGTQWLGTVAWWGQWQGRVVWVKSEKQAETDPANFLPPYKKFTF